MPPGWYPTITDEENLNAPGTSKQLYNLLDEIDQHNQVPTETSRTPTSDNSKTTRLPVRKGATGIITSTPITRVVKLKKLNKSEKIAQLEIKIMELSNPLHLCGS